MGHFWWKLSKLGHFGGQNYVIYQNFGKLVKNFISKKFIKIISVRFKAITLVKNIINLDNFVKICHFWWKWSKLGHFWGKNDVINQNILKIVVNFPKIMVFYSTKSVRRRSQTLSRNSRFSRLFFRYKLYLPMQQHYFLFIKLIYNPYSYIYHLHHRHHHIIYTYIDIYTS